MISEVNAMNMNDILLDIKSPTKKNMILDTDAYNEVDDQYAIAYSMLSSEKINLMAICAAPFFNSRSSSAGDGMEQSYHEIFKIAKLTDPSYSTPIYRGSSEFLSSADTPVESEAADKIAELVLSSEETVYIAAVGAITNVASAIIKYPEIVDKAVVIWLGGHALHCPDTAEFNLRGDLLASQVVFDSGIPIIHIPCRGMCSELITTVPELEYYLSGKNELCDYLVTLTKSYNKELGRSEYGWSKVIWDVTAPAILTIPEAFETVVIPRPFITSEMKYSFDMARAPYIYVRRLQRNPIYAELFRTLSEKR
ncbi:MAG: nucleoside hydrolase [Ruminococcaceae bacterium]|nr:nucleoside hydrolase [Oscillospiraceae bacterium]